MKRTLCFLLSLMLAMTGLVGLGVSADAAYKLGDTFTFGSYPQTRVTDTATVVILNLRASSWNSLNFYSGSGSWNTAHVGDFAKYCDVTYNGAKYRGVKFSAYRPTETIYATSTAADPTVSQQYANGYALNTTYWFKYEPLQWRVLDPSTGLVLCLSAIDSQPFNNEVDMHDGKYYNKNNSSLYYAADYTHSSLRTWLNDTFLSTAFSAAEQDKIVPTTIHNKGMYTLLGQASHPELDFPNTTDKVFIPAFDEVIDTSKGYKQYPADNDPLRKRQGTDYAKCMGIQIFDGIGSYWRLRTAGQDTEDGCCVNYNGRSAWGSRICVCKTYMGIVPMLCCSDVKTTAPSTVTVTFNPNGGSVSPTSKSVTVGGTYGTLPTPTRTGFTFLGWYDGTTQITASTTVTNTAAHTLLAKWTSSGTKVTVTFDPNGGSVSPTSMSVTVGYAYGTLPTPNRFGYTFLGWYDGNTKVTATTTVTKTAAHTLTAKWQGAQVTVYFDANGGAVSPTSKTVHVGEAYGTLPTPTRASYTFLGWYVSGVKLVEDSTIVTTVSPHTLTAKWQETGLLPTIAIDHYVESRKVDYRTTITFNAAVTNVPYGAEVHWFIDGQDSAVGNSYTASEVKRNFTVQAKLMLGTTPIASSMTETVTVKTGFFARLVAFFRSLFRSLPVVTQEVLGVEIYE